MATEQLLKFVNREQAYPAKRDADARAADFREIAERYAPPAAEDQAGRCSQCGVPY
ncbi:MAG TPA: NAD(P)-dependent oxidoreductase, partial [Sphingomonas sp.]|nr:NAD(P)-dependent oxidoreductase [Sphingomonas sp.]